MCRKDILLEMDALHDQCFGCQKPPFQPSHFSRNAWCRDNCPVYTSLLAIGKLLDATALEERAERAAHNNRLPEHHFLSHIKNGPDALTSDPEFQEAL